VVKCFSLHRDNGKSEVSSRPSRVLLSIINTLAANLANAQTDHLSYPPLYNIQTKGALYFRGSGTPHSSSQGWGKPSPYNTRFGWPLSSIAGALDAFQSQMRSLVPRHRYRHLSKEVNSEVSISDEKPVPAPRLRDYALFLTYFWFQSQMRSQFPRHLDAVGTFCLVCLFQSQMRRAASNSFLESASSAYLCSIRQLQK